MNDQPQGLRRFPSPALKANNKLARERSHRRTRRLLLESLEERIPLAVRIWDGGGGDANWTTAANWAGDISPLAGDDLVFAAGAAQATNTNNFAAGTRFNTIQIQGSGYNISGNAIELYGGLTANNAAGTNTLGLELSLINAQTLMNANPGSTPVSYTHLTLPTILRV